MQSVYDVYMDLRVNNIDKQLMARLKSDAALSGKTLRQYVIDVLMSVKPRISK